MSHMEELAYLTDKIAPRVTITIPMLEEDLGKTLEEMQNQVNVAMTINEEWNHLKLEWFKFADTEKIVTISRLIRAAGAARDSYLKLCTRLILTAKWMEKFRRIELEQESRERVWLDDILCMDMKGQMKKMNKIIEKLEKEERVVVAFLQTRNEDFHRAQRDQLTISRLKEQLREAEWELFSIKAKRARLEMGTEEAPPNPPETSKNQQLPERKEESRVQDLPRLVDDEEEEMELEEELMVIDEDEVGEENSARHRQEAILDDDGYLDQLLREAGETPPRTRRTKYPIIRRIHTQRERRHRASGGRHEESTELQNHIQELEARIQVAREENRAREEEVNEVERAIQVLPRRILLDAPEKIPVNITCAFYGDERYNLALEEGLCHRCLLGHGGRCRNPFRPCYYCEKVSGTVSEEYCPKDEDHHKALCPIPNAENKLQQRIQRIMGHYLEVEQDIERMEKQRDDLKNQVEQILRQDPAPPRP
ncbi:unnamed protein product [Cylicocyclus nassatus]|uniref:Uncharacterized protein n=1 Tax=Cylicocyclus nassatus TaxID=53992 RepID=A0AA36DKS8_CYLNA|nr:unnamed protein product [Cylicocyclus nassatus]